MSLPSIPPIVLLLTRAVSLRVRRGGPAVRWIGIVSGVTLLCIAGVTLAQIRKIPFQVDYSPPEPLGNIVLAVASVGSLLHLWGALNKSVPALLLSVIVFLGAVVFFSDGRRSLLAGQRNLFPRGCPATRGGPPEIHR